METKVKLTRAEYLLIKADIMRNERHAFLYRIVGFLLLIPLIFLLLLGAPPTPNYLERLCIPILTIFFLLGVILLIISCSLGLEKRKKRLNEMWEGSNQEKKQLDQLFEEQDV
jgi:cytochrome bd-type quinol oxidase subunit 2